MNTSIAHYHNLYYSYDMVLLKFNCLQDLWRYSFLTACMSFSAWGVKSKPRLGHTHC